ncbi:MAG: TetR/AcrR family transcriptional regulator [Succinivibrio sp.]
MHEQQRVRRKDTRPREIIEAALRLFTAKGYHETSLADIANETKMARSTIYLYFEDKEDLLHQAVRMKFKENRAVFLFNPEDNLSLKDILQKVTSSIKAMYYDKNSLDFYSMVFYLSYEDPEIRKIWQTEAIDDIKECWRKIFIANGLKEKDAAYCCSIMFSLFFFACADKRSFGESSPFMRFDEQIDETIERITASIPKQK